MAKKSKPIVNLAEKYYDTPIERILKRPRRLFASLVAQREIKDPKKRSMPLEEVLIFVSDSYEVGES